MGKFWKDNRYTKMRKGHCFIGSSSAHIGDIDNIKMLGLPINDLYGPCVKIETDNKIETT